MKSNNKNKELLSNEYFVNKVLEARNEIDGHIEETNSYFKDKKELTGVYLILSKYITEWTSLEIRIGKLLNNAHIYELVKNEDYYIIFDAIDWLIKEKEIYKKAYPHQEDEFNNYINCLNEYRKIIEDTFENGFDYYDNLVLTSVKELESNALIEVSEIE